MPEIQIRPAKADDIHSLMALDHNYASDYVWQMDFRSEENQTQIVFREMKLPRSVQVTYPRDVKTLADEWTSRAGILVATLDGERVGYISFRHHAAPKATWATDLVVLRRMRRQGIGSALVFAAQEWAQQHGSRRLILEMQPKNHPAICLAEKLGFELCGYNDHYFANNYIAIFFSKWVR